MRNLFPCPTPATGKLAKTSSAFIFLGACALMSACDRTDDNTKSLSSALSNPTATTQLTDKEVPSTGAVPVKEWTFMVYLNGDNNLDSFGTSDMNEMKRVGSTDKVNIIVLRDTYSTSPTTKLYQIEKDNWKLIKDYGTNVDTGDWNNFVAFFDYVKTNFPAKHYMLDMWNHGSGWSLNKDSPAFKGISYDDHSGNHITTKQLGMAMNKIKELNGGKKIDILGFDACLMQMMEVYHEVKDTIDVYAGSEEVEAGDGWDYNALLAPLAQNPLMTAEAFAANLAKTYVESYMGGSQGTSNATFSTLSATKMMAAMPAFNAYVTELIRLTPANKSVLKQAIASSQSYTIAENKDFIHFINLTKAQISDAKYQKAADDLIAALRSAIFSNYVTGSSMANSNGLAMWMPAKSAYLTSKAMYNDLNFSKDTKWSLFLETLLMPNTPELTIDNPTIVDENNDGFITPGEKLNLTVKLSNGAPIAASNISVSLVAPEGITASVGHLGSLGQGSSNIQLNVALANNLPVGKYDIKIIVRADNIGQMEKVFPLNIEPDYVVENYALSTAHPYANSANQNWVIEKTGAKMIRLHFSRFETEARYDFVSFYDRANNLIAKWDGAHDNTWSPTIPGDYVKVVFTSDSTDTKYGFDIDKIAH